MYTAVKSITEKEDTRTTDREGSGACKQMGASEGGWELEQTPEKLVICRDSFGNLTRSSERGPTDSKIHLHASPSTV